MLNSCHSNVGVSLLSVKRRRRRRREVVVVVVVVVKRLQGAVSKARLGRAFPRRVTGGETAVLSPLSAVVLTQSGLERVQTMGEWSG